MKEGNAELRIALPSDGALHRPALDFLRNCGLPVSRISTRQYTGRISRLERAYVLFQRAGDIPAKVEDGTADMGITGLDRFLENRREAGNTTVLVEDLDFGQCVLVLAVPEAWLDINTVDDLRELSEEFRRTGRQLRIATKYPRLVQRFLLEHGIAYYSLVYTSGGLEAAPSAGYADLIADISATGNTLRENRLKPLQGGVVVESQACLLANVDAFRRRPDLLAPARALLESVESYLRAEHYYHITANVQGPSVEEVSLRLLENPHLAGLKGPTISPVFTGTAERWFSVSLLVPRSLLLEAVDHLRKCGGTDISAVKPSYIFGEVSTAYRRLLRAAQEGG